MTWRTNHSKINQLQIKIVIKLKTLGNRNILGVSKASQPPKSEFSIIKIEVPMYVVNALASRILCALIFIRLYGHDGYSHREREIEDARSIRDAGTGGKRKETQTSSIYEKKSKASNSRVFQREGRGYHG